VGVGGVKKRDRRERRERKVGVFQKVYSLKQIFLRANNFYRRR
jgi:hypothetical protein